MSTNANDILASVSQMGERVRTKSLDVSFNEILDMYASEELIINPAYQRLFRWSESSQSRFIESLILEMPIPPIFVIEIKDGQYELVDGLQRISTYLNFRGQFRGNLLEDTEEKEFTETFDSPNDGDAQTESEPPPEEPKSLILQDCEIVRELNGQTFDTLPTALQIRLKRNFIRMEVLRSGTSKDMRYHMFKRLNTGGMRLSDQEERNCIIRLLGDKFNEFLIKLSANEQFQACISSISAEQLRQKYDQELVLRFFALNNYRDKFVHDVRDFLTDYMERVSDEENINGFQLAFDYTEQEKIFQKTFALLSASIGEYAFSRVNQKGNLVQGFSVYHFECITMGVQGLLDRLDASNATQMETLKGKLEELKRNASYQALTKGGGKNTLPQLKRRIGFVEEKLGQVRWT